MYINEYNRWPLRSLPARKKMVRRSQAPEYGARQIALTASASKRPRSCHGMWLCESPRHLPHRPKARKRNGEKVSPRRLRPRARNRRLRPRNQGASAVTTTRLQSRSPRSKTRQHAPDSRPLQSHSTGYSQGKAVGSEKDEASCTQPLLQSLQSQRQAVAHERKPVRWSFQAKQLLCARAASERSSTRAPGASKLRAVSFAKAQQPANQGDPPNRARGSSVQSRPATAATGTSGARATAPTYWSSQHKRCSALNTDCLLYTSDAADE